MISGIGERRQKPWSEYCWTTKCRGMFARHTMQGTWMLWRSRSLTMDCLEGAKEKAVADTWN